MPTKKSPTKQSKRNEASTLRSPSPPKPAVPPLYESPPLSTGYHAIIQPLPSERTRPRGARSGEAGEGPDTARSYRSDLHIPSIFDKPTYTWTPRQKINGSPRTERITMGVDLLEMSKRPGPGQYHGRGFTGRDRSMRRKLDIERFNCGQFYVPLPDVVLNAPRAR